MVDHWFDRLHKSMLRENPRRTLLGAAGVVASLAHSLASDVTLGKPRKHKDKQKHKKKDRKPDKRKKKAKSSVRTLDLSCDGQIVQDTCHAFFEKVEHQEYCLDTCEECQGTGGWQFCVYPPTGLNESVYLYQPACCPPDETCCATGVLGECCPSERCCKKGDQYGCCKGNESCCPGGGCVTCQAPKVFLNPDTCQCECSPDIACPAPSYLNTDTCACELDGCSPPFIPNPCPGLPGACALDTNIVCCVGYKCLLGSGNNPDHYSCCGRLPEDGFYGCVRADERCAADKRYPPLGTNCPPDDPVCSQPPGGG